MTDVLRELYQEVIIDHGRHPRHCHPLPEATCSLEGYNPLCGDKVTVHIAIHNDTIQDISFEGTGCAISIASASLMTDHLKGKTLAEARPIFEAFHRLVTEKTLNHDADLLLGKLKIFAGVQEYPMRVKCATLAWHTFIGALNQKSDPISTE